MNPNVVIYTDGSSRGNPGPGGYGIVMIEPKSNYIKEFTCGSKKTTNNRLELIAVLVALEKIKAENQQENVNTDSKYVSDAVEKKWVFNWEKKDFKSKKNPDLWKRFLKVYKKHKVYFFWVKGHSNNLYNEKCDYLAVEASKNNNLIEDSGYEQ